MCLIFSLFLFKAQAFFRTHSLQFFDPSFFRDAFLFRLLPGSLFFRGKVFLTAGESLITMPLFDLFLNQRQFLVNPVECAQKPHKERTNSRNDKEPGHKVVLNSGCLFHNSAICQRRNIIHFTEKQIEYAGTDSRGNS